VAALLLEDEDLETLKVGELTSSLSLGDLLTPRRLGPLLIDSRRLPELGNSSRASSTGELRDNDLSQSDVSKRDGLTGDTSLRTVNENLMLVVC
jgi:hypothetical protein